MMNYKLLWKYPIDIPVVSVSITADGRYIVAGSQRDNNVYLLKSEAGRGELLWGYGTGNGMALFGIRAGQTGGQHAVRR